MLVSHEPDIMHVSARQYGTGNYVIFTHNDYVKVMFSLWDFNGTVFGIEILTQSKGIL